MSLGWEWENSRNPRYTPVPLAILILKEIPNALVVKAHCCFPFNSILTGKLKSAKSIKEDDQGSETSQGRSATGPVFLAHTFSH